MNLNVIATDQLLKLDEFWTTKSESEVCEFSLRLNSESRSRDGAPEETR